MRPRTGHLALRLGSWNSGAPEPSNFVQLCCSHLVHQSLGNLNLAIGDTSPSNCIHDGVRHTGRHSATFVPPSHACNAELTGPETEATREEMRDAKLPLAYRDSCAHLLIPLNRCRYETYYLPWKCEVRNNPSHPNRGVPWVSG